MTCPDPTRPDMVRVRIVPPDADPDADPEYTPTERAVFRMGLRDAAGGEWAGDPLGIEARFDQALPDDEKAVVRHWLDRKNATVNIKALRRVAPAIAAAFALPPLDPRTGQGVTAEEGFALLDRFHQFRDATTARYRRLAEMAHTFPSVVGERRDYLRFCGLHWNRDRCQALHAAAVYRGVLAGTLRGPMDPALAEALAGSPAEAERIMQDHEGERQALAQSRRSAT